MIKWIGAAALSCAISAAPVRSFAQPDATDVPAAMQGVWGKQGRCDVEADRLTITSRAAGWGSDPSKPVHYSLQDHAVFWDEEYDVDNFVAGRTSNFLVYNAEGFNMPGQVGYVRCSSDRRSLAPQR